MIMRIHLNKVYLLVLQVTKHGLILDFLSSFSGQVDFLHMEPEQASSYTEGTEVKLTWLTNPFGLYKIVHHFVSVIDFSFLISLNDILD